MLALVAFLVLQQPGPVLPVGTAPHLAELNFTVQKSLEAGDFDVARAAFAKWPTGKVTYSAAGLPTAFDASKGAASALVKEIAGGHVDFEEGADPRVVFTFGSLPPDGASEPEWRDGKVYLEVPVTDRDGNPANPRSVTTSLAKGMAYAAGLDITTRRSSLMGYVVYAKNVADPSYSQREQTILTQVEDARKELAKAVNGRVKLITAVPVITVTPGRIELGTVTQGDRKDFSLTLKNTGNAPAMIEIETTCSCLVAQPSFVLMPGETITQKPRFDSSDYQGELEKHLYVLSNAPGNPRTTLVMHGIIVPEVRFVEPHGARTVNAAAGNGLFEVEVAEKGESSLELLFYGTNSPVELLDIQLGNRTASAQIAPFSSLVDDPLIGPAVRSGAKVQITVPESWPLGVSWLRVVGVTNSRRRPSVEMTLQIRKGISVSPQSMYFGDAKIGVGLERTVMVEHGSKEFTVTKVEATEGIVATVEKADESGRRYRITAKFTAKQAGQVSGAITLSTSSPLQPTVTIQIGGLAG
ncbi:MAG: DUF1573 domain-containing protein [Fimbriimonadales bacterium]